MSHHHHGHHGHHHRHHDHHHDHHHQVEQYGAYPAPNAGYYEAPYALPAPAYGGGGYSQPGYGNYGYEQPHAYRAIQTSPYGAVQSSHSSTSYVQDARLAAQEHKHKQHEHMAELGALGAGAFAIYEHHQVKVDPAHAGRHRMEEAMAGAAAVGLGGYALHEHHKVQQIHQLQSSAYPSDHGHHGHHKKHHHGFFK